MFSPRRVEMVKFEVLSSIMSNYAFQAHHKPIFGVSQDLDNMNSWKAGDMLLHRIRAPFLLVRISARQFFTESPLPPIEEYKNAMAAVGSQAMILTASFSGKPEIRKMHGTTLSSVSSLTVNPEPIVQFNIQVPSATSKSIHDNKYLALHILRPSNESVRLARNFSLGSRYINGSQPEMKNANGTSTEISTTPFERINKNQWSLFENVMHNKRPGSVHLDSDLHLPILTKDSERILICQKYKVFKVFNHEIWTCKVREILVNIDDDGKTGGLLYFDRKFHHVGEALIEIKKDEKEVRKLET